MNDEVLETQRWRERRDSYRKRGEAFDPSAYGVELLDRHAPARDLVVRHHYAASWPSVSVCVGLYQRRAWFTPELVGVCTFGTGTNEDAPTKWLGVGPREALVLNRLVLLDEVPFNGESWFVARAFAILRAERPDLRGVLSYSDPVARRDETGRIVMPGHVGVTYQAKGARRVGVTASETKWLDARGCVLDPRSLAKVRNEEEPGGASYAAYLVALGAPPRRVLESPRAWVERITRGGEGPFTRFRHPGNYIYAFGPSGTARDVPPTTAKALPYPIGPRSPRRQELSP